MKISPPSHKMALVLPGGGARGAFQVGVLKAIAELLPEGAPNPFPILSGTSAGAINSIVLASRARRFKIAVQHLEEVWQNFESNQVFRTDGLTMLKSSLHWLSAIVLGGTLVGTPKSLLHNEPLRHLLSENIRFPRIQTSIDAGLLDAVAITAAGYASARSTSFFQASAVHEEWARTRRAGVRSTLNLDHLMASVAVPLIFPPVMIHGEYFGDGAMRQATPLSPAVHLGADRILVIGVRDESGTPEHDPNTPQPFPSLALIAGYMLDTLFMDGLYSDLERLTRINQLLDCAPAEERRGELQDVRPIDTMVIVPSEDLREIANEQRLAMPRPVRALLRGIGGRGANGSRLLSFLMFEKAYTSRLIDLGYRDAMEVRDELRAFVTGADVARLSAPERLSDDLTGQYRKLDPDKFK
ncbi:MAG: patatin-like phospholipase family protein [Woeseia sp.]|nr:patatin-like phospholipase family protein [Woeseia sp.]MBT8095572.1 patatin-like phospholipase family protein [Woeseia sp.]NNE61258.1 patatin-like phospholipase family protein [Woeseia sp.]NNL53568.1 patatin-like phospholipase family protein [Woeseia sp.]